MQFHDDCSYYGSFSVHYSSHLEALHSRNISCGQFSCFIVVLFCILFFFSPLLMQLLICHWTLSTDFASLLSFFTYFLSLYFPSSFGEISSTSPSNYYNMFAYFLNLSYHSYIYPLALSYSQTVPSSKNPALNL